MDMIITHADENRDELRDILVPEKYDAQVSIVRGASIADNDWSMTMPDAEWEVEPILIGHHVYIDGTEWGGVVETLKHDTAAQIITVTGALWRGMLKRKVIIPPSGQAYYVADGEANAVIAAVVGAGFGDLFAVSDADTGVNIAGQWRYVEIHDALEASLEAAGLTLNIVYSAAIKSVVLSARAVTDSSAEIDLSQDYGIPMVSSAGRISAYNHIVALGAGELLDRDVVHVYRLDDGSIATTAPDWAGTEYDRVTTYDYNNPESIDDLISGAAKRLIEYAPQNGVQIDPGDADLTLPLGDIVGARDRLTGLYATARVVSKILTIDCRGIITETRVA